MKLLIIDACIRGDASATRRFYLRYLETRKDEDIDVSFIDLSASPLKPLSLEDLALRDGLSKEEKETHAFCALAREFRDADEILVAAPYWDLSFPSCLKVYLEHVSISGITFGYDEQGRPQGFAKARKALYFSTSGGMIPSTHRGYDYVAALFRMFGIEKTELYLIQGLDMEPGKREQYLEEGLRYYFGE